MTGTLAGDLHARAQQCLVQHFEDGDAGIRAAQRELKRLEGWLEAWIAKYPAGRLFDDDIDRACLHTTRLLGVIARLQGRQAASALALSRIGTNGNGSTPGGSGGRSEEPESAPPSREPEPVQAKSDANPMSLGNRVLNKGNPRGNPENAPRCQARRKSDGGCCRQPAMRGRRVCRLHGGKGGAPTGERHGAFRHGLRAAAHVGLMRQLNGTARRMRAELAAIEEANVPSPLAGEGQGGGSFRPLMLSDRATPHPNPPPQGGEGIRASAATGTRGGRARGATADARRR
jgi:hypothetical protein